MEGIKLGRGAGVSTRQLRICQCLPTWKSADTADSEVCYEVVVAQVSQPAVSQVS